MLWQLAALKGLAKRWGTSYRIPGWKYSFMFQGDFGELPSIPKATDTYREQGYGYDSNIETVADKAYDGVLDIEGYFQSEKYFEEDPTETFVFDPDEVERVHEKYKDILSKPTIAVGVRRGDYLTNGNYHELPARYFIQALQQFDYTKYNIVFISDDRMWCWFHFKSFPNAYFPEGDEIDHFILGSLCTNYIVPNSTFHWWSARLGKAERIIQPAQLFAKDLLAKYGDVNFYLENERFTIYDYTREKIDLKDLTITIPVRYDHPDRLANFRLTMRLLRENFDTNFIIYEQETSKFREEVQPGDVYLRTDDKVFHRTKMLNEMAELATTEFIANYDCDIVLAPAGLLRAVQILRDGLADFVYPYEYTVNNVAKLSKKRRDFEEKLDPAVFAPLMNEGWSKVRPTLGGIVLHNRKRFLEAGGENEKFISYGPEDVERFERLTKLDYRHKRIRGHIYHLDHFRGKDSGPNHGYYDAGVRELLKIREMVSSELKEYIQTWK